MVLQNEDCTKTGLGIWCGLDLSGHVGNFFLIHSPTRPCRFVTGRKMKLTLGKKLTLAFGVILALMVARHVLVLSPSRR